jgi:hypothetical protein
MSVKTKVEYESLDPSLIKEAQQVISQLSDVGSVTVSLSAELAHIVSGFLKAAAEGGAVAFGPVNPNITPSQAAKLLGTDQVMLNHWVDVGLLTRTEDQGVATFSLPEVLELKKTQDIENEALLEASRLMETLEPMRHHG